MIEGLGRLGRVPIEDAAAMVVMLEDIALFQRCDMAQPIRVRQLLRIVEQFFGDLILGDNHEGIGRLTRSEISCW